MRLRRGVSVSGRGNLGDGLVAPTGGVAAALETAHSDMVRTVNPYAGSPNGKVLAMKALAHAVCYRAQLGGVPTSELVGFMRSVVKAYIPHGSQLAVGPKARAALEDGAGMPVWPNEHDRERINVILAAMYRTAAKVPPTLQISIYWDMLMRNAESMGMTHEALIMRLEVLDRLQRADGPPKASIPKKMPAWARAAKEARGNR